MTAKVRIFGMPWTCKLGGGVPILVRILNLLIGAEIFLIQIREANEARFRYNMI